jgi:hypothetical protein
MEIQAMYFLNKSHPFLPPRCNLTGMETNDNPYFVKQVISFYYHLRDSDRNSTIRVPSPYLLYLQLGMRK